MAAHPRACTYTYPIHSDVADSALDDLLDHYVVLADDGGTPKVKLAGAGVKPLGVGAARRGRHLTVTVDGPAKIVTGADIDPLTVRELAVGAGGVAVALSNGAFKSGRVISPATVTSGDKVLAVTDIESKAHAA